MSNANAAKSTQPHEGSADETARLTSGGELMLSEAGTIEDFISGKQVRATPEEVEAVQVFSRRLVDDFGYPKSVIQTRPQFRVRRNPSDEGGSYPVDIAVFKQEPSGVKKLYMVVECKKKSRKDGLKQLKLYMDFGQAEIGVWFNGVEHAYLRRVILSDGTHDWQDLPSVPRFGQRVEDIGKYRKADLVKPTNLRALFRDIRNHLAGQTTGITRDEALAREIVNLLFCKLWDETNSGPDDFMRFRCGKGEPASEVKARILALFEEVKEEYYDVFSKNEVIELDEDSILYVVGELQNYELTKADRDAIGDAFEVFIGPALRGTEGQFFTPRNVVKMMIEILDPDLNEMIIDPACGSGGFLVMVLEHVWRKLEKTAVEKGWDPVRLDRRKRDVATRFFRGIEKDSFLAKVTKAYMAIIGDGRGGVFCENSLQVPAEWNYNAQQGVQLGTFQVVLTNPPFGTKIPIKGTALLEQYDLAHKWKKDKKTGKFEKQATLHEDQPPQILFIERCLQLLAPDGRMGVVLPESILGNPSYEYLLAYLEERTQILGIVTLPEALFKTSGKGGTHTKTCALFLKKKPAEQDYEFFMADARWCGHDSRGNPTWRRNEEGKQVILDDTPTIAKQYDLLMRRGEPGPESHLGFRFRRSSLKNRVLVPKFYDPELSDDLAKLSITHDIVRLGSLVEDQVIRIDTGVEVGKMAYGTGTIPFIRTSDISNWELKADPKQGVSEALYNELRAKLDVQAGDILMVRDGTYLIGTSAIVTESDVKMLYQSHLYKIRVLKPEQISPWLLLASLNTPIVKRQIRAKQFTQDIIDTLGNRILELILPLPNSAEQRSLIASKAQNIVETRVRLRNEAKQLLLQLEGVDVPNQEDEELLDML